MINETATIEELWRENAMLNDIIRNIANSPSVTMSATLAGRISRWKGGLRRNGTIATQWEIDQIRKMRAEGRTDAQIAGSLGRTSPAIRHICIKNGIPNLGLFGRFSEAELNDAILFRSKGFTWKECAELLKKKTHWQQLARAVRKIDPKLARKGASEE